MAKKKYVTKDDSRSKRVRRKKKPVKSDTIKKRIAEKQKLFLQLFEKKMANISETCTAINISRETYYDWCRKYKYFKEKCHEIEESFIDFAESQLLVNIKAGKEASLIFFLCNRRGDRWKSIQNVKHSGSIDTEVTVVINGLKKPKVNNAKS